MKDVRIFCGRNPTVADFTEDEAWICMACLRLLPDDLDRGPDFKAAAAEEMEITGHRFRDENEDART